jgi:hypothetical protein
VGLRLDSLRDTLTKGLASTWRIRSQSDDLMKFSISGNGPESIGGGSSGLCPGPREQEWKFVVMPKLPVAWTRTTYLDTPDLAYFRTCARGFARKLRIRQYARAANHRTAPVLGPECFLELKESGGHARSKCRFAAAPSLIEELVSTAGEVSVDLPPTGAFEVLRRILRRDRPVAQFTSWYQRSSRTGDGVRVTVDASLTFARAERPGRAGDPAAPADPIATFPFQIVEVKHTGTPPAWLVDAANDLPEASAFSKFREGMACLGVHP